MAHSSTRRTLASLLRRALPSSSSSSSSSSLTSRSRLALAILDQQSHLVPNSPLTLQSRIRTYRTSSKDPSPTWSSRPPKETILLDGCDYEHWLVVLDFPTDPKPSEEEMIDSYVKTLASVLESEEEAKKKIYSVCTTTYTGFGALISEELSYKLKGLPGVLWVLPDSYLDVPSKDYGGDLYVDGKVIHRPQYRFQERKTRRTRPRQQCRETLEVESGEPMRTQHNSQQ